MSHFPREPKVIKFVEQLLKKDHEYYFELLLEGKLYDFELELFKEFINIYNEVCEYFLDLSAKELEGRLKKECRAKGGRRIVMRPVVIRNQTGHKMRIKSPYVKQPADKCNQSQHLLARHWTIIGGCSPCLYDKVGYCSVLCPSYDLAHQTLSKFGVTMGLSSVNAITSRFSSYCFNHGEEKLMLEKQETLAGKRVVISVDGGRTRTRAYNGKLNANGHQKYETPWKEPKLFVIDVLDQDGRPDRYKLPIYGCRFDEESMLKLIEKYLASLAIEKASQIQILADGAPWIWNKIKPLLLRLGVTSDRIIETLDYYHASQYVHDLVNAMPKRIGQKQKKELKKTFENWLWDGKSDKIVAKCKNIFKRPNKLIKRWMNYLDKHNTKTQYADYKSNKLMCGSGIIESGVRRIINLRFKNASTFWKIDTVEKLYFLRAALLAKRWNIVIGNLVN